MDSSSTSSSAPLTQAELDTQFLDAVRYNKTATVLALITAGADVNAVYPNGYTALRKAANFGHIETVTALLSAPGILINYTNPILPVTALILAATNGHTAIVFALITAGADDTVGALVAAAGANQTATVSALISHGVNVTEANQYGETALMAAAVREGQDETAFCLLNAMSPQEISATRPYYNSSFINQIPPIVAAYNQALNELRQGLRNVVGAFNEDASRHNLGTANALMNIIAGYYAPNWCGNPNQEMSHALAERRRPVILSCTSRAMNRVRSTLARLTNAATPAVFRLTEEPAAEQGPSKKARCD